MSVSLVPIVVAVVGLVIWFISPNAKAAEAGKILFFVGSLAALMTGGAHSCSIH